MRSNLFDRQPQEVLGAALAESEGDTYVVDPDESLIEDLIEVAGEFDGDLPTIRMLTGNRYFWSMAFPLTTVICVLTQRTGLHSILPIRVTIAGHPI